MTGYIQTKLLFEYKKGKLLGLGFGNIINSEADIIGISAFDKPSYKPDSAIGSLQEFLFKDYQFNLENAIGKDLVPGKSLLVSIPNSSKIKKVLIVCMGDRNIAKQVDKDFLSTHVFNNLQQGLEHARMLLQEIGQKFSMDMTALGTRYGGLRRKESYDLLLNWSTDLFNHNQNVNIIRLIAYDLDTFIDFFESLFRLQVVRPQDEFTFPATYHIENYAGFQGEITSAFKILDDNPRGVIITCRSIIEMIVKIITGKPLLSLSDNIYFLKDKAPQHIYSYLTTCRLLGNFSNHDPNFKPTRRDAEAILLLTLRIVEWHLAKPGSNDQ